MRLHSQVLRKGPARIISEGMCFLPGCSGPAPLLIILPLLREDFSSLCWEGVVTGSDTVKDWPLATCFSPLEPTIPRVSAEMHVGRSAARTPVPKICSLLLCQAPWIEFCGQTHLGIFWGNELNIAILWYLWKTGSRTPLFLRITQSTEAQVLHRNSIVVVYNLCTPSSIFK